MKFRDTLVIALIILIVALSCLPLFKNIQNINLHWDWLQMLSYYKADRQAILQFHQFPLRTHYFGGGYPLLANPQDGSLNPFLLPVLIFGEVIGLKINILLAHLIGALGMFYLTRYVLRYNYLGALFSTFVFCLGGHMHRIMILGQEYISLFFSFFTPLLLAFFIRSKEQKKYLVYSIFLLTVITSQAGLYCLPVILFIFLYSCMQTKFIYLKNFFLICFFSFLLGAAKNFPMLELLGASPRLMDNYNPFWGTLPYNLYKAFLARQVNFSGPGEHWNYFYLGYIPLAFTLASFLFFWKKTLRLCILLVLFAFFSFSAHRKIDLFALLWQLPLFHSIEAPTRYFVPLVVFIIALGSGQFFLIKERFSKRFITLILILLLVFTVQDLFFTNNTKEISFPEAVPKYQKEAQFFSVKNSKPGNKISPLIARNMFLIRSWEWTLPSQYELMQRNIGKINWYGNIHLKEAAEPKYYIDWNGRESLGPENSSWRLNPDYRGEIYFLNNPDNKAEFSYFSPNAMTAKVNCIEPDILVINQNCDAHWRSNIIKPFDYNGLLAVNLTRTGEYQVKFIYLPLSFYLGLNVSLITFMFIIGFLKKPTVFKRKI